jgi:hypothetical protein
VHDRVLRPAMVVVGKGKAEEPGGGSQEPEQRSDRKEDDSGEPATEE